MEEQKCVLTVSGHAGSNAVVMELTSHGDDAWVDWIGLKLLRIGTLMLSDDGFRCELEAILEEYLEELHDEVEGHA